MTDRAHEKLPDAELEVLARLDQLGEATARELREALAEHRPMAHGSILTLLGRLEAKSLVERHKGTRGKAFVFRPTRAARRTFSHLIDSLVGRVFGGDSLALVTSLFETRPPDANQLADLRNLVERLEQAQNPATEANEDGGD